MWEHAVGQWQSLRPVASACCLDRGVLGDKAVQELACLHPRVLTSGPMVPFRLYFRGGQLVLDGEVDSFSASLLAQAVAHVDAAPGERLMIDARGLTFLNHRGLAALVEGLADRSAGITLLGGPALVRHMCTGSASRLTCSTSCPAPGDRRSPIAALIAAEGARWCRRVPKAGRRVTPAVPALP